MRKKRENSESQNKKGISAISVFSIGTSGQIKRPAPFAGEPSTIDNSGHLDIRFLDPGLYEVEVIWKMPPPPDGMPLNVEVSRVKKKVVAGDFAAVAASLGMTISQLEAEICPSGPGCFSCVTISEGIEAGARGMTVCDGKGRFVPMVFRQTIVNEANAFGITDVDTVVRHLEPCVMDHELRHVQWNKNNLPDACKDVCCDRGPGPKTNKNCIETEKDADLFGGIPCLSSKLTPKSPLLTALTADEKKYLEEVLANWEWRAHNEKYPQCENLP